MGLEGVMGHLLGCTGARQQMRDRGRDLHGAQTTGGLRTGRLEEEAGPAVPCTFLGQ